VRLTAGDPPLGTGRYRGHLETVPWPLGARLTLYTDGLVEHRGSDLDLGINALAAALDESRELAVEALPGTLVDAVLAKQPDDDVAILVAEACPASEAGLVLNVPLLPIAVADVRRRARELLDEMDLDDDVAGDALLIVSELVTNAIRYGRAPVQFAMRATEREVVVEVADAEHTKPQLRAFDPAGANGRGLHMVESLGARWGVRPTGLGKSVWCTVPRTGREP
jgi:anti-sigma regulatory factor (Ser/Thr protein kinase)